MIVEIGEKAVIFDKTVTCYENKKGGCTSCVFENKCDGTRKDRPACFANERPDKKSVNFR